jgi:hypothetical protein
MITSRWSTHIAKNGSVPNCRVKDAAVTKVIGLPAPSAMYPSSLKKVSDPFPALLLARKTR